MDPVAKALLSRGGKQAELRAWQPGWMDTARHAVADALRPVFGGDGRRSQAYVDDKIKPTAEYLPGVGDAMAVGEARDAFSQGNYLGGGLLAAGAAMGLVPGVGDVAQKGIKSLVKSRGDEVLGLLKAGRGSEVTDAMLDMGNAADNANLNAYLFENYDLPMDEASRMGRAQQMGLPDNYYHGTASDVAAFDRSKRGQSTNAISAKRATWMADQPSVAEGYATFAEGGPIQQLIDASYRAESDGNWDLANDLMRQAEELEQSGVAQGGNVMPLRGPNDVKSYDAQGEKYDATDYVLMDKVKEAQAERRKGVRVDNFVDNADYSDYTEASHLGVFNPADIRSRFARFDPRLKHLRNLSAGVGGLGLLGVGAMQDNEAVY